jgi:LysR family transcriptional regulator, hydrogen peroxide-inducible genes activator
MDLREVDYFLAVVRTMNFTRAADQCGVTQPTLTRGIQRLERQFGGPLLARERGNTHLTALGRLVHPQLQDIVARSQALQQDAESHARLEGSDLRLGVMCSIGPARFAGFLSRFRAARPGIAIMLADATPDMLCQRLLRGEHDAPLTAVPDVQGERLRIETLYTEYFHVACSANHPFAARPRIRMQDMDGQIYLSRINCEHREVLGVRLAAAGAKLVHACRSEREDWIQHLVAAGMGVCFLPEFSAAQPGVVLLPIEDAPPAREVCLVTVAGRRWSSALACFVEATRRERWQRA